MGGYSEMTESDLVQVWRTTLGLLDFAVFVVRDEADPSDVEGLQDVLDDIAEAGEATILVVRESLFADFRKLTLQELLMLQGRLEEAVQKRFTNGVVGDA
jgi:hypothetical protein